MSHETLVNRKQIKYAIDINNIEGYRPFDNVREVKRVSCIYLIISPKSKIYIGQTVNFQKRYNTYKNANQSNKTQGKIYNSIKKYGFEKHYISILLKCDKSDLNMWERFYIKLFSANSRENGLNLTNGGDSNYDMSDYTKDKLSKSILNNPNRMDACRKRMKRIHEMVKNGEIQHPMKGRNHSKESIAKILKTKSERTYAPRPKKVLSEETKEKLRQINLGKKQSPETIQKKKDAAKAFKESGKERKKSKFIWTEEQRQRWSEMSKGEKNGNFGKGMKDHVKAKLLEVNLGKKASEETKLKQSLARKGKPKSEEWKAAMRHPHKQYIKKNKI